MVYEPRHQVIVLSGGHSGLVRSDLQQRTWGASTTPGFAMSRAGNGGK
jgi:hypothetical protein